MDLEQDEKTGTVEIPETLRSGTYQLNLSPDRLFLREIERSNGLTLVINQCQIGDVGCVVWDAALVLAHYLDSDAMKDKDGKTVLDGKSVIELGSGTGVVGIQAAACGAARCTVTDLAEFVPLMTLNIEANNDILQNRAIAQRLDWGSDVTAIVPPYPDYILLADCIYYEKSLEPLVKTIDDLSDCDTTVLCCYEMRTTGNKPLLERRFLELAAAKFRLDEVPLETQHPMYRSEDIRILKMTKILS